MDAQLTRVERWPVLLAEAVEDARSTPFAWGTHDCATWAFSVVAKLRGEPPPEWIGRYTTKTGALRILSTEGVALENLGTALLGAPLDNVRLAQRGDVVFYAGAYGVCIGADVAMISESGLVFVPLVAAQTAWRV